ncbi:MAG: hypothetical protein IJP45_08265 [Paludibacteraceae bacterium]|nr:hypothetical protein [Paludibacteraceae bacterium]MBQ7672712.1 hypothetical protein [Paludibacteraceae bacterium]
MHPRIEQVQKMTPGITYMLLYSASLAFIVLHLYSGVLKWVYRPKAYDEHFHELFPAQRAVGVIYLMQVFEIPYLLHIGKEICTTDILNVSIYSFFSDETFVGAADRFRDCDGSYEW